MNNLSLKIEKLIPGGQALATLDSGKKIFLWNALPGEIVTKIRLTKEKSGFAEGIAEEFAQTSPHRIPPRDTCFLATSPWQILDYAYELEQKREILCEIFRQHQLNFPADKVPAVKTDGQDFHYRNKMEYSLYYSHDDAKIHPAFHGRGSHTKIPVAESSLERPEIWQHACAIIAELNTKREDARKYQSLLLRCNQNGQVSGGLYENGKKHPRFAELSDQIFDVEYKYSPNGFFQINLPVYEMALREISPAIKNQQVLDLYSGVGTIGFSVARNSQLTLVECDRSAYDEMVENAKHVSALTGNSQINPVLAKSEESLEYIAPHQTVIVDPPRAGCDSRLLAKLLAVQPSQIIYLSCNPATQARDVAILSAKYQITKVQPYNFFPRTPHLENLIILEQHGTK